MNYYLVATSKQAVSKQDFLTYQSDLNLDLGQVVLAPLGRSTSVGVVYKKVVQPDFTTKNILASLDGQILPKHLLNIASWMSEYYVTALPQVLQSILPAGLQKKRRQKKQKEKAKKSEVSKIILTPKQKEAIKKIEQSDKLLHLLHGVTGSGKTTIYIELAKKTLQNGKSVIVIVPEIALTTQLIRQFTEHFEDVVLLHSRLSESERHQNWLRCLSSDKPKVVIGARSALFAPLKQLGLIVIDECHESSLKQDRNPRYASSRVAGKLASLTGAKLVLGSATPSISDYWLAIKTSSQIIELPETARATTKPRVTLVDMTKKSHFSRHTFLSDELLSAIKNSLAKKEQALLFHNRRGSSSATLCRDCGWLAICPTCQAPLTLHHDKFKLICHICGFKDKVPHKCPDCASSNISHTGIGTKLVESEVAKLFPKAKIARFDADSASDQSVDQVYDQLVSGEANIIIGTQVITKGLNLPKLSTVGIIQADAGLALPDFSTAERNFQQIAQVVGRVGRDQKSTEVIIQTYRPEQSSIKLGLSQDYQTFYQESIKTRRQLNYPPFCYLLKLVVTYKTEMACIKNAQKLAQTIRQNFPNIEIIGPTPAFYERLRGNYRWQLIIKSKKRPVLQEIIKLLPAQSWQYDIDPESLL